MNEWLVEMARLLKVWAPLLTDYHAEEMAREFFVAWPDDTPRTAMAKFLREVPLDGLHSYGQRLDLGRTC